MTTTAPALRALEKVNFEWTMHTKSVWQELDADVAELHVEQRHKIFSELERLRTATATTSPLGLPVLGSAGSGKTHLVAAARAYTRQHDISFILVDMTDVHDFWDTVLQGYVNSLQVPDDEGIQQFQRLLDFLISYAGVNFSHQHLAAAEPHNLNWFSMNLLSALSRRHRLEGMKHQDVIRALVLLNSNDFILQNLGYSWLLGIEIDEEDRRFYNFSKTVTSQTSQRIEGLSWLMSLRGPTLVAIDQMDSIVTQHHLAAGTGAEEATEERQVSRAIIEGIGGGLMGLRDVTLRTLTLVSCLDATWEILCKTVVQSFQDRFQIPLLLETVRHQDIAAEMISQRLQRSYQQTGFVPPYATWPFSSQFLEEARRNYPRKILQRCHRHREECLTQQVVWELDKFTESSPIIPPQPSPEYAKLDAILQARKRQVDPLVLRDETTEDTQLAPLTKLLCKWLIVENPLPDNIDTLVDVDFGGGHRTQPLHARLRLVFRDEYDRERHLSIRALQRLNAVAYQSRLRSAMVISGIDRSLSFRYLMIVRNEEIPSGKKTQALTELFKKAGGHFVAPSEDALRTLMALTELQSQPAFADWLRSRRPVSQLPFLREAVNWLYEGISAPANNSDQPASVSNRVHSTNTPKVIDTASVASTATSKGTHRQNGSNHDIGSTTGDSPNSGSTKKRTELKLTVGQRLVGSQLQNPVTVALEDLRKHVVVLAGSGAGKTVLVKRLIEEATLLSVPSIVIDGANDLARLGDQWPAVPEGWHSEDTQKAKRYQQQSEVVIWTPGLEAGNPLNLEPLPDLAAMVNDPGELDQAAGMACEALQEIVASGRSHTDTLKRGILRAALENFARLGSNGMESFVEYLSDLPSEAGGGIQDAPKKAREMADRLRAEILVNPLLRQSGSTLDPALLFGLNQAHDRTRISVLNLSGLAGLNAQQQFLNQLAMTLFTWIKKNPAPANQALRGLLVIDEAKDFIPSRSSTPCKSSLLRLAAQARKYGLGLIFATQEPKSIDHGIIANCATQFFGRASSPAAIEVVEEQIKLRGGSGHDIARLTRGQFYAALEGANSPVKIQVPLCLSYHATSPLNEEEVLARAAAARQKVHA
jgi:hypothetical protein